MPPSLSLPSPDEEYFEMEAAKAFHYRWGDWLIESPVVRAKLVAHELHRGMREAYTWEMRGDKGKKVAAKETAPWEQIRKRFFK